MAAKLRVYELYPGMFIQRVLFSLLPRIPINILHHIGCILFSTRPELETGKYEKNYQN